jgi:antitoxin ParD1/3/4
MNVNLTPELEEFVTTKVKSGRYNSASEVVREALRLLVDYDATREARMAAFNVELGRRIAEADSGDVVDVEEAFARLRQRSAELRKRRG